MHGGGNLFITTTYIDNDVHIFVRDTGTGISVKNISKIFEPYFTTKETGTGLGLTLVFKIIREHRGEIMVSSEPGEGTEFEIVLPIHQRNTRLIAYNEGVKR
jgi:signal transduction histidine kinase